MNSDYEYLESLLKQLSFSLSVSYQNVAAKKIRQLTKRMTTIQVLFRESTDAICQLLDPLSHADTDLDFQEDPIASVNNISFCPDNLELPAKNNRLVPLLIESVKSGTVETRRNATAALLCFASLDSNKFNIVKSGVLKPLIDILGEGDLFVAKDALEVVFKLCFLTDNRERVVNEGAVGIMIKNIIDGVSVDEFLRTLALLAGDKNSGKEMVKGGIIPNATR